MTWTLRISETTQTLLRDLNRLVRKTEHPRQRGKGLSANLTGLWRYRVGDDRLICDIQDGDLMMLQVVHRSQTYRCTGGTP